MFPFEQDAPVLHGMFPFTQDALILLGMSFALSRKKHAF